MLLASLSGCAGLAGSKHLENQFYFTVAGDECGINSKWGMFGITTTVRPADCNALLQMTNQRQ